ncbi:hypothetical protein MKX03_011369, partial [Papaver bracteatum]
EVIGGLGGRDVMTMKKVEVAPETTEPNYAFGSSESSKTSLLFLLVQQSLMKFNLYLSS